MSMPGRFKSLAGGNGLSDTQKTLTAATTLRLPDFTNFFLLTGTATVTSLVAPTHTRDREVTFIGSSGATTFTNTTGTSTANQMDLGGGNVVVSAGDVLVLILRANGVWNLKSVRYNNASSVSVASATTTTVPDTGRVFVLTGTATITSLAATDNDTYPEYTFIGGASAGVVFTNTESPSSAGEMYLHSANRLLQEQDVIKLSLQPGGWWFLVSSTTG